MNPLTEKGVYRLKNPIALAHGVVNRLEIAAFRTNDAMAVVAFYDDDPGGFEPIRISVNLPDKPPEGCFYLRYWSEHVEIADKLLEAEAIRVVDRTQETWCCQLNPEAFELE